MSLLIDAPEVQAALIAAVGSIAAALIAAVAAALIGHQVLGRKRLVEKLELARNDIQFLLEVERQHCSVHRVRENQSNKLRIRKAARAAGYRWTGKFTSAPDPRTH